MNCGFYSFFRLSTARFYALCFVAMSCALKFKFLSKKSVCPGAEQGVCKGTDVPAIPKCQWCFCTDNRMYLQLDFIIAPPQLEDIRNMYPTVQRKSI